MILTLIDFKQIFLNDLDGSVVLEIGLRTFIMFTLVLVFLRSTGKKGVRQLSIFEVAIIISLGSAAGDPMLSGESAIVPSLLVFVIILILYRLITLWAARSQKVEDILEGKPLYIIEDGVFTMQEEGDANFAKDEFFAEMRAQNIEHLGQVRTALLESNGQVSFLYYTSEEEKKGLPVYPKPYSKRSEEIKKECDYACTHCGQVTHLTGSSACDRCGEKEWVEAIGVPRNA
jgi:uncharacterized membrane protein YcaP (DUF421 family)